MHHLLCAVALVLGCVLASICAAKVLQINHALRGHVDNYDRREQLKYYRTGYICTAVSSVLMGIAGAYYL